jgi:hypothetical protein
VLLYGHLDKQPEMVGWHEGYGPWSPRYEDGKLYGRGGADDGYAVYASLAALKALDAQGLPHARCVGVIETCEESGSYDLPAYLELLAPRMGDVDFVDRPRLGRGDYERLWLTTSLRGLVGGTLSVEVLTEGVHSGDASGVVPSSFRIARKLLDRVEDSATGRVLPPRSTRRSRRARRAGARRVDDPRRDDGHALPVVGTHAADGRRPARGRAQPHVAPGAVDHRRRRLAADRERGQRAAAAHAAQAVAAAAADRRRRARAARIEEAPRARSAAVGERAVRAESAATGWNAPPTAPWLAHAVEAASRANYAQPSGAIGEGGTIPFMGMLGSSSRARNS